MTQRDVLGQRMQTGSVEVQIASAVLGSRLLDHSGAVSRNRSEFAGAWRIAPKRLPSTGGDPYGLASEAALHGWRPLAPPSDRALPPGQ